jgi:hypothetical protein
MIISRLQIILFLSIAYILLLTQCSSNQKQKDSKDLLKSVPAESNANNEDEIKEILRLTRVLSDIESRVSEMHKNYGIITLANLESGQNNMDVDQKLLSDIDNIMLQIEEDKEVIAELQNQLQKYESNNENINEIKKYYAKIIEEKNIQIAELELKIIKMQVKIINKDALIHEQASKIDSQNNAITKQSVIISEQEQTLEELSRKNIILYSRRKTVHEVINGNVIHLPQRERRIELISEHNANSYVIKEEDGNAVIYILSEEKFWDGNNYLIVRVKRGRF